MPAEIVAFFIFANGIRKQADKPDAVMAGFSVVGVATAVFIVAWLLTPLYLARVAKSDEA